MNFKEYRSISNSYSTKFVDTFEKHCEKDIRNIKYVVREKLDGANMQLIIDKDGLQKVGKRSTYLKNGEGFFDIWNTLKKYEEEIKVLAGYALSTGTTLRVFGELYGPGINKRINYGSDKKIAIFDIYYTDDSGIELLLSQKHLEMSLEFLNISHMLPALLGRFDSLEQAMGFDVENNDALPNRAGNFIEGAIIQPYDEVIRSGNGERFVLKKKCKMFEDKRITDINAGQRAERKGNDVLYDLNKKFRGYITKNRVIDTFSKYGTIQSHQQIGEYIKHVLNDAKIDFLKEVDISAIQDYDQKKEKALFNVGGEIVNILKEYL